MKNAGPPWLGRSDVSGNLRHAARTLASALATTCGGNRLTFPHIILELVAHRARDPPPCRRSQSNNASSCSMLDLSLRSRRLALLAAAFLSRSQTKRRVCSLARPGQRHASLAPCDGARFPTLAARAQFSEI